MQKHRKLHHKDTFTTCVLSDTSTGSCIAQNDTQNTGYHRCISIITTAITT